MPNDESSANVLLLLLLLLLLVVVVLWERVPSVAISTVVFESHVQQRRELDQNIAICWRGSVVTHTLTHTFHSHIRQNKDQKRKVCDRNPRFRSSTRMREQARWNVAKRECDNRDRGPSR